MDGRRDQLVRFDNLDGDGANGYGHNSTETWANIWTINHNSYPAVNTTVNPGLYYTGQTDGKVCEMTDSVFYNNKASAAYTEAIARGVFATGNNNVNEPSASPITAITRASGVVKGGKVMEQVTFLDPRPANSAFASAKFALDTRFSAAKYRGAFLPLGNLWTTGWTAAEAFGFIPGTSASNNVENWADLGHAKGARTGTGLGDPILSGTGSLNGGQPFGFVVRNARPNSIAFIAIGSSRFDTPFLGGTLVPNFSTVGILPIFTNAQGTAAFGGTWPNNLSGDFYLQAWVSDPNATSNVAASNAIQAKAP